MIIVALAVLSAVFASQSGSINTVPTSLLRNTALEDWRSRQSALGEMMLDNNWLQSEEAVDMVLDFQAVENARLADMVRQGRSVKHEWGEDYVEYYAYELGPAIETILGGRPSRRAVEVGSRIAFNIGSAFAALLAQQGTQWPQVFTDLTAVDDENVQGKAASVLRFMLADDSNRARLSVTDRRLISQVLIGLTKSHAPAIQREAALGLAGSDSPEAVAALVRLATGDPDSPAGYGVSTREAAQEALAKIRGRK